MTKQSFNKQNEDEEYRPTRPAKTGSRKKKPQVVQNELKNSSKWTHEQNKRFLEFVRSNKEMLACPLKRKEQRVFLQLSRFIITRTPDQCRSHHQKMIKHHNDLEGIIQNLEKRLSDSGTSNEISQNTSNLNEMIQKKEKVEENQFFDAKIDIQIEYFQSGEKDLWGILNEQIWIERPIEMFIDF